MNNPAQLPPHDHVPAACWTPIAYKSREGAEPKWHPVQGALLSAHQAMLLEEHGRLFVMQRHEPDCVVLMVRRRLTPPQSLRPAPTPISTEPTARPSAGMVSRYDRLA